MSDPACTRRCPLCGGDNRCAMAADARPAATAPCWCAEVVVPPQLLEQVPPALRGKACICEACVRAAAAAAARRAP
jgi:hypothetical protein